MAAPVVPAEGVGAAVPQGRVTGAGPFVGLAAVVLGETGEPPFGRAVQPCLVPEPYCSVRASAATAGIIVI